MNMKSVLVVDDDELLRGALVAALEDASITVESAKDGKEGLAMAEKIKPAVIVTDENMPKMSGHQFIKALHKTDWGKEVAIIVFTVNDDIETLNQELQEGVVAYLNKPTMSATQLVSLIKKHLDRVG